MEQRPTKKQRELLSFIDGFIKGNGYGPSYREIMRALDAYTPYHFRFRIGSITSCRASALRLR